MGHRLWQLLRQQLDQAHELLAKKDRQIAAAEKDKEIADLKRRLVASVAAEEAQLGESTRLLDEVDRLRELVAAALAAGSHKGRQMLYLESLRQPFPRAKDRVARAIEFARSPTTWREDTELDALSRETLARIGPDLLEPPLSTRPALSR